LIYDAALGVSSTFSGDQLAPIVRPAPGSVTNVSADVTDQARE
jgi:hypothetical protein